jgi:hypothetical protein
MSYTSTSYIYIIKVWANDYMSMRRNPTGYHKLLKWDIDTLNDMMFSFWLIRDVPATHPQKAALEEVGICFECSCPQFAHYNICKHVLSVGLWKGKATVPTRFSTVTVGKRKAPAGARLNKRSKCMVID